MKKIFTTLTVALVALLMLPSIANAAQSIDNAKLYLQDKALIAEFDLTEAVDLTVEDIKLEYFTRVSGKLVPLRNSLNNDESLVKNNTWAGYLWDKTNLVNYSNGDKPAGTYGDLVPATTLQSMIKKGYHTNGDMDYIELDWKDDNTYVVRITVGTVVEEVEYVHVGETATDVIANAPANSTVVLEKETTTTLTAADVQALKDNGITIEYVVKKDGKAMYSWTFKGSEITTAQAINLELLLNQTVNKESIEKLAGRNDLFFLSFSHSGAFPAKASIKAYVGDTHKAGESLVLFYYNEADKKVEEIKKDVLVDAEGYVTFEIDHASEYYLQPNTKTNPQTGDINLVKNGVVVLTSLVAIAGIAFIIKKQLV